MEYDAKGGTVHCVGASPNGQGNQGRDKAIKAGKSDVECMTILKEAYENAMVLLGFSISFDEEE